jgi:capsular polysaccharide biosynthesis protein
VSAQAVTDQHNLAQPYIALSAYASSQSDAATLANAGARALQQYILKQQQVNNIPPNQRVILQVVASASPNNVALFSGRKKTTPIVIFLTVLLAGIGLAFVLENLRPRVHSLPGDEPKQPGDEFPVTARRTA